MENANFLKVFILLPLNKIKKVQKFFHNLILVTVLRWYGTSVDNNMDKSTFHQNTFTI